LKDFPQGDGYGLAVGKRLKRGKEIETRQEIVFLTTEYAEYTEKR
jgi:hypothetical protein